MAILLLTRRGRSELVGIALAGAIATKLTVAPAVAMLALFAIARQGRPGFIRALSATTLPIIIALAPFAIRNLAMTGDPIFPVGHVLVGRPIPGVTSASIHYATQYHSVIGSPLGIGWTTWLWPVQPDEAAGLHHLLLGFVALLIAVRERWTWPLLAPIFGFIAVGVFFHLPTRYLLPMFFCMAAFEATALELWIGKLSIPAGIVAALPAGIAAAGVVISTFSPMAYLEGRLSREQVLRRNIPGYAAARRANMAIHHGWIMAMDFPAPYYLDHPWIAESVLQMPPLKLWMEQGMTACSILRKIRHMDVRLILVTPGYGGGTPFSMLPLASTARQVETIAALRRHLHRIATVNGVDLWEVPRAPWGLQRHDQEPPLAASPSSRPHV